MDDSELEPDPRRRIPAALWFLLAFGFLLVSALVLLSLHGRAAPRPFGPPAGSPEAH